MSRPRAGRGSGPAPSGGASRFCSSPVDQEEEGEAAGEEPAPDPLGAAEDPLGTADDPLGAGEVLGGALGAKVPAELLAGEGVGSVAGLLEAPGLEAGVVLQAASAAVSASPANVRLITVSTSMLRTDPPAAERRQRCLAPVASTGGKRLARGFQPVEPPQAAALAGR